MGWGAGIRRGLLAALLVPVVVVLAASSMLAAGDAAEPAPPDPVERLRAGTVLVRTGTCESWRLGSGVVVDGRVVTNDHVVDGGVAIAVRTEDGTWHRATGMRRSSEVDLAILEVDDLGAGLDVRASPLQAGDRVWTAGHPGGGTLRTAAASVSRRRPREVWTDPPVAVELSAAARPGQSGSPVVDADGHLVGLVYAAAYDGGGALVIDGPELARALDALTAASGQGPDDLGVEECPGFAGQ